MASTPSTKEQALGVVSQAEESCRLPVMDGYGLWASGVRSDGTVVAALATEKMLRVMVVGCLPGGERTVADYILAAFEKLEECGFSELHAFVPPGIAQEVERLLVPHGFLGFDASMPGPARVLAKRVPLTPVN